MTHPYLQPQPDYSPYTSQYRRPLTDVGGCYLLCVGLIYIYGATPCFIFYGEIAGEIIFSLFLSHGVNVVHGSLNVGHFRYGKKYGIALLRAAS